MFFRSRCVTVVFLFAASSASGSIALAATSLPENFAARAKVTASAEYNGNYRATNLIDGQIPDPRSRDAVGKAWCVRGPAQGEGITVTFQWAQPVTVAAVVYYGRTAFHLGENWKDLEIRVSEATEPVDSGFSSSSGTRRT